MRFSETLNKEGGIDRGSLRNAENTDVYILAGKEEEEFKPRFSYRGFRYVEVCAEGKAELREIVAEKLRTNTRQSGKFACSDEFLNRLHEISVRTESCNHHGILTDCPQRDERMGWLNDLSSRLFQTCNNFGMEIFLKRLRTILPIPWMKTVQ
ncbi:MAG: family 78 glycoside hydrolase catalytic domain [Christensenellaceae bacterium]